MDVLFDIFLVERALQRFLKSVEAWYCLATERTHDAVSNEGLQKEKLNRVGNGFDASAVLYGKTFLNVLEEQMLSTAFDFISKSEDVPVEMTHPFQKSTARR